MRLVDKVVNSPPEVELLDGEGRTHRVIGVGAKSDAIKNCPLRYILDPTASDEVGRLVLNESNGLFDPASPLLRLPAETFWLEWFGSPGSYPKAGVLVETEDGRSGTLTGFFESEQGQPDKVPVCVDFDLSGVVRSGQSSDLTIRHNSCLHLNDLLACATARIDPRWDRYFRTRPPQEYGRNLQELAEYYWFLLPVACAFAAMLNSPDVLIESRSSLDRLNNARARRGREPLLDHIEISIRLGQVREGGGMRSGHQKSPPRLHHVRGHFVHRAGKTFWRSAHLRGDAERPIFQKTVNVRGSLRHSGAARQQVRKAG